MMSISGAGSIGIDPVQMQQKMQEKLSAADTDGNDALSKTEAEDALSTNGIDSAKFDKIFDHMDEDGDGELSSEEQEEMLQAMQERMQSFAKGGGFPGIGGGGGDKSLDTLLESLKTDETDSDKKTELEKTLEKLRSEGYSEQNVAHSFSVVNSIIPAVNTTA